MHGGPDNIFEALAFGVMILGMSNPFLIVGLLGLSSIANVVLLTMYLRKK